MIGITSFLDLLTFGFAVVVAVFFVMALGLCVALVLDYVRR